MEFREWCKGDDMKLHDPEAAKTWTDYVADYFGGSVRMVEFEEDPPTDEVLSDVEFEVAPAKVDVDLENK